jgi:protein-S-isoprenylcysteine O-methyltransferase Ste14
VKSPSKSNQGIESVSKSIIVRYLVRETLGTILIAVILVLSSGQWGWIMGWALFGITLLWVIATATVLIRRSPHLIAVLIFVVRTALEDKTLQDELEGYEEYTRQTRYRLIPGLW